ncbi:quinoprotein dehydrogenase-associated putative ABC transporter substrate-binding protein [Roseitranquillus sediminis]|uniref:quinoprotein dehydrogenase-associated putative ABC transporter substrate-binding protein n=1 Tax=Roseitranquillus sediminis TaxID=2809051 RepID=UPI001D0C8907|nr:quinoprotein dehydrogenase-associated putative ABC transporter substrate-binding protein [Roseitranquillus sediminis]MBM9595465.1 quinoprotein dehydrogenase-associated putative ABC transporter substrate-binding protein [Roseitranquillus sediminis]
MTVLKSRRQVSALKLVLLALANIAFGAAGAASAWEMRVCSDPDYMPFSNRDLEGLENRIATILADEMGAELAYKWWPQVPSMVTDMLREGECDMIMGVPDSQKGLLPSLAYYQSPYVFVYRADADYEISSFDDPDLEHLKLGVQSTNDRAHTALGKRGLNDNVALQFIARPEDEDGPFAPLVEAVASGEIDVAVPWGPVGGYYAARQPVELTVTQAPHFDLPFTPMFISVVIGVRRGDEALRDRLDIALASRWDDVLSVLEEYDVPTIPLARPIESLESAAP